MNKTLRFGQYIIPLKRVITIFLCAFFSFGSGLIAPVSIAADTRSASLTDTVDYLFSLNNIEVVDSENTESTYPTWAKMDPDMKQTSLSYWVKNVLPFKQDRNKNAYLIYPKAGIVVPVLEPSSADKDLIKQGKAFNHYPYLEQGSLHYFGLSPSQGAGNMSIAAHSSYLKQDPGRYKTVFQALPISNIGDVVWYFEKNSKGTFDRYEYEITQSFDTDKYNVSILGYNKDGNSYLTTYGCYPIGSNERRWVNKALLKGVTLEHSSLSDDVATPESIITPALAPTAPSLGLPLDMTLDTPDVVVPQKLIGINAIDARAQKAVVTTPSKQSSTSNPQDIAAKIAAALAQKGGDVVMLGAAPTDTNEIVDNQQKDIPTLSKPLTTKKPRTTVAVAEPVQPILEPTKTLDIDTRDAKKLMRQIIVQTTTLSAGDVVEVPITVNPILATNACYTPKSSSVIALGENTTARDQVVFQGLMHAYGLTSFTDTDDYKPENGLKRYEAAKILVNFAKNVLCRDAKATYIEGMYSDIAGVDPTLVPYIKEAYEYGIMKGGKGKFRPLDRISRQEFVAGLMRILMNSYLTESNSADWYKNYEAVFADYGLNTLILTTNTINRYDISKIFYKIYYSDAYQASDAGYVLPSTVE